MTTDETMKVECLRTGTTWVVTFVASLLLAVRHPSGLFEFESAALLQVLVPVAGTFVALALAAAQIASSALSEILADAQSLIKEDESFKDVAAFSKNSIRSQRRNLETMKCVITFSTASLIFGFGGLLGLKHGVCIGLFTLLVQDLFATLCLVALVASVFWTVRVVKISFDYSQVESVIQLLEDIPIKEQSLPKARAQKQPERPEQVKASGQDKAPASDTEKPA